MKRIVQQGKLPLYLVIVMLGMCGVLFARQLEDPLWRALVVLISVAGSLFAGGNVLGRLPGRRYERWLAMSGLFMLVLGAVVTLLGFYDALGALAEVPPQVQSISHWVGLGSLLLGLLTILFTVARTGEEIETIGERFRYLANHMSEGFALTSPEGRITFINQRFSDMTGTRREEAIGAIAHEFVQRLSADGMAAHLERRRIGVASEYQIACRVHGEERQLWVSGTPIYNSRGQLAGSVATFRDVTEQHEMSKRLERYAQGLQQLVEDRTQKLRNSERRLRDLLVHMNEGFVTVDATFKVRFANHRICELLRREAGEVVGRDLFEFVEPTGRARLLDLFEGQETEEAESAQREFELIQAGGALAPVVAAIASVADASETEARFSLVITDIHELKQMQRQLELRAVELEATNEELKSIDRAKDGFLSNVSHELRTPLSTIRGYLEMLTTGNLGPIDPNQANALKVMGRNAQRLSTLIDEMIEFSRMEIRGIALHKSLFPLDRFIYESVASMQPQILARGLSVASALPQTCPPIWADRKRLLQVLGILLSNAIKFSAEGGKIDVSVTVDPAQCVRIVVRDYGIGIDAAYQRRVFDKFFQVDSSMTRNYEGAGIGLSIAKNVVEAHGGWIELDSALGKGSAFTVALPGALFDPTAVADRGEALSGLRAILMAEDAAFRAPLVQALRGCGCVVEDVSNVYEGLRLAAERPPDVALCDEGLVGTGVNSVIARLRMGDETSSVPVLVLGELSSGNRWREDWESAPVAALAKPFASAALVDALRALCFGIESTPSETERSPAPPRLPVAAAISEDKDFLEWMVGALRRRDVICYAAVDMELAARLTYSSPPVVVLLDENAIAGPWEEAVAHLRAQANFMNVAVYVLSGFAPDDLDVEGAAGIIHKPFSIGELTEVITHANRQRSVAS